MIKKLSIFTLLIAVLGFNSCETDFSVNGNYEITPVVIGVLDHTDTTHIVKITKAFLGDGDNLVYAQNPDSNYFNQVDAWVKEINPSTGEYTGREWNLHDSIISNKNTDGIFYAPEQKVYVFYESTLDENMEYELTAMLEETYPISSKTQMLGGFKVSSQLALPTYTIGFAPNTVDDDTDYDSWSFTVTEADNAANYNFKYFFRWRETYADMTTQDFVAEFNDGDVEQEKPSAPSAQVQNFAGVDFYNWVRNIIPDDPDVIQRRALGIDLRISVAHKDLDQYMKVGAPVTGIVQSKPEFTNINGGLGIWSSRLIYERPDIPLNPTSMKELCAGLKTSGMFFCSDYPEHIGEMFECP